MLKSTDLIHWTVINDLNNPIASVFTVTISLDTNGVPASPGTTTPTIPSSESLVGDRQRALRGTRLCPRATQTTERDVTVIFAGYHTPKPKNGLGNYRTIGRFTWHASADISQIGASPAVESALPAM